VQESTVFFFGELMTSGEKELLMVKDIYPVELTPDHMAGNRRMENSKQGQRKNAEAGRRLRTLMKHGASETDRGGHICPRRRIYMKLHQNQKQILILGVMVVLGALLNAAAELLPTFGLNRFPVAYTGTILVTILCGAFPGMLAGAGALLPIYLRYLDMYGADFAKRLLPIE